MQSVVGHEEGHELGLGHANKYTCPDDCYVAEYEDYMSVMGSSLGGVNMLTALNSAFRSVLGWTQPGEETVLTLPAYGVLAHPGRDAAAACGRDRSAIGQGAGPGLRRLVLRRVPARPGPRHRLGTRRPGWCCEMYDAGVSVVYREAGQTTSVLQPSGPAETYSSASTTGPGPARQAGWCWTSCRTTAPPGPS